MGLQMDFGPRRDFVCFVFLFCFQISVLDFPNPNFKLQYKCTKINPIMRCKLYLFLVTLFIIIYIFIYLGNVFNRMHTPIIYFKRILFWMCSKCIFKHSYLFVLMENIF
jgi:hypothetical protein